MFETNTPDNGSDLLTVLRRIFAFDERRRFILLFLVINVLIFILIWLAWQNQVLIQEKRVLETRIVVAETRVVEEVVTCEVDCTDKMSTVAARYGTEVAQTTATLGALITDSPTPGTPTATPTLMPTPTHTSTPLPTPTDIPTLTPTPLPTFTPIPTATPEPPTPPDIPTPLPTPEVLGITPTVTVQSIGSAFPVTITGKNFRSGITVRLGANIPITVTGNTATTITGTLSPDIPVSVYGLTVTNLDDPNHPGTLSPAFTVYDCHGITIPLESPYLVTFGSEASSSYDSGYQVQRIFFEVPEDLSGDLYVRIFDADTGGPSPVDEMRGTDFNTTISYTLYGSGTPLLTATIGYSDTLDNRWDSFLGPFSPDKGELVEDRRIFNLTVEGQDGDDANWYRVALSTSPDTNTVPSNLRMFAFSWTVPVRKTNRPYLHAYVKEGKTTFVLRSFGCDTEQGRLLIRTPFRNLEAMCSAEEGKLTPEKFDVRDGEDGMTWMVDFSGYNVTSGRSEYIGVSAEDENGLALPIFTRPTLEMPP